MFRKYHKRSSNPLFVIFRLCLSLAMFVVLFGGIYSAYKHFSGLDPLKLNPQALLRSALESGTPQQFLGKVLGQSAKIIPQSTLENLTKSATTSNSPIFRFLLVADSHDDNANLQKAIAQAKQSYPDLAFVIGLGDYTNVGTVDELKLAKKEFDLSSLRYFLLAGDHDLWDSRNRNLSPDTDFKQVFGPTFQGFTYNNFRFLLLDNSDNYKGFGQDQSDWVIRDLDKAKDEGVKGVFVFVSEPLYHPSSDHYMGKVEKNLKQQAQSMIYQLKATGVKKVFAGDIHYFSEYEEPETKLPMVTVGAIVTDRNPQAPRFSVVTVFDDGLTKVDDVEIR